MVVVAAAKREMQIRLEHNRPAPSNGIIIIYGHSWKENLQAEIFAWQFASGVQLKLI